MRLLAPLPSSGSVTRWVNPITPPTGPSAGKGTEAPAVRAHGQAATSYKWLRLMDFHKLIRQRESSRGTTIPRDTDTVQEWTAEVGATVC